MYSARNSNVTKERLMSDHKHGEMDIKVQTSTFDGFIKFATWSCVVIIGILVFMAIFAR